jgi:trehalose 6-phosphate phosphatase
MPVAFPLPPLDLKEVAMLLDVDGTLLDIAPTPGEVFVPPSLRETLQRLFERGAGAVAFVSGRPIRDLDRIFTPLQLPAIGGHGAEFRAIAGYAPEHSSLLPLDADLRRRLAQIAGDHAGVIFEDKGYSIALHYRRAPQQERYVREQAVAACAESPQTAVELLAGKSMIEVKQAGVDKASGVRKLMTRHPFARRRPIFMGDDVTDEGVFAIMPEFDGIAIAVGERYLGVENHMDGPADVRAWLEHVSKCGKIAAS